MKTSQNLLVEIKDEMGLKEVNGEAGWAPTIMHTYKLVMTSLGYKCSYSPLNNFYSKGTTTTTKCKTGGGCTCR